MVTGPFNLGDGSHDLRVSDLGVLDVALVDSALEWP